MGADVMRWQYCSQPPNQNLLFGFGPAHEIQRRLLTLWNSCKFLVDYANVEGWEPDWADLAAGRAATSSPSTAGSSRARGALVARGDGRVRELADGRTSSARSSRSSTTSRTGTSGARAAASGTATRSRCARSGTRSSRACASCRRSCRSSRTTCGGVLTAPCPDAPASVHLAGWPEVAEPDTALLAEIAELRRVVELGRQARSASGLKLRQPLRALVVEGAPLAEGHADEIAEELRVQEVCLRSRRGERAPREAEPPRARAEARASELGAVRAALEAGDFEELPEGGFRAAGHELGAGRGARRAPRQGGLGGRRLGRHDGRARSPPRRRAASAAAASTTSSTRSTPCARRPASS